MKSLISIAFEVEKADVLLYEGDPDTFKEIVPQSTDLKLLIYDKNIFFLLLKFV